MSDKTTISVNGGPAANVDKVIEALDKINSEKQPALWDEFDSRKIYKCVVAYVVNGEDLRVTLYCRSTDFESAREIVNHTIYMTEYKRHGHIVGLTETKGQWIE